MFLFNTILAQGMTYVIVSFITFSMQFEMESTEQITIHFCNPSYT
jgi:hypothetical protein